MVAGLSRRARGRRHREVDVVVRTLVRAAPEVLFDLELDVDVHAASLADSDERAVTSSGRSLLGPGDEVTFTARHLGLRWSLTSRVVEHDRPRRFVDEQVRGPFTAMRHEHRFDPLGDGRTAMTDRMTVRLPGGVAGALVARSVAGPYLARLLRRRGEHVRRLAEQLPPDHRCG